LSCAPLCPTTPFYARTHQRRTSLANLDRAQISPLAKLPTSRFRKMINFSLLPPLSGPQSLFGIEWLLNCREAFPSRLISSSNADRAPAELSCRSITNPTPCSPDSERKVIYVFFSLAIYTNRLLLPDSLCIVPFLPTCALLYCLVAVSLRRRIPVFLLSNLSTLPACYFQLPVHHPFSSRPSYPMFACGMSVSFCPVQRLTALSPRALSAKVF